MSRQRLGVAVLLSLLFGVLVAHVANARGSVDRQAWARSGPVLTFSPAEGELYVAATAGNEEARSFVHVDLRGTDESAIRSSRLVLAEAASSFRADTAAMVVCALDGPIERDGELSDPPAVDCSMRTSAQRGADGTWTVELNVFVERWTSGDNHGLALFPDSSISAATFRVAFDATATTLLVPESTAASPPPTSALVAPSFPTVEPNPVITPDLRGPTVDAFTSPTPSGGPRQSTGVADSPGRVTEVPGGRSTTGSAVAWMMGLAAAAVIAVGATPLRRRVAWPTASERTSIVRPLAVVAFGALSVLPLLGREVIVYKAGVVMIFFVAAIGLHVLVNWAGELSLAHAGMVGLPAFSVLALSAVHDISPVYLLPVGVLIGAAVGAIVALPTLRARGVQVALVTLIAGIAIDRYFFSSPWLVGPVTGRTASLPRLGPIDFTTNRSLYVVLWVTVAGAVLAAWILMHSKVARAWYWIRVNADAAAAFGIPVVLYRVLAYATGGAFAGLAGGLTVMWTQRLGPGAFPASSSFTYLLVAVLAGAGFVGGVIATTVMLPGGQQFATNIFGVETGKAVDAVLAYGGPVGLINVLVFHKAGLNGLGRNLMTRIRSSDPDQGVADADRGRQRADGWSLSLIGGILSILAGFVAIALAWDHASTTDQLWVQNQEILSGGIGGLALVLVGVGLLIRDRLERNHQLLARQLEAVLGVPHSGDERSVTNAIVAASPSTVNDVSKESGRRRTRPLTRANG